MQSRTETPVLSPSAVDALHEGVAIISASGTVTAVNATFCEMVGCSADDIVGTSAFAPPWRFESPSLGALQPTECPPALALRGLRQPELTLLMSGAREMSGTRAARWVKVRMAAMDPSDTGAGAVMVVEDLSQLVDARTDLDEALNADPLTGLATRARIMAMVAEALAETHPEMRARRVGVLHVDLDGFRMINDSFGPAVGDAVLIEIAHRLLAQVGDRCAVGRVGVDEFLVLALTNDSSLQFDTTLSGVAATVQGAVAAPIHHDGLELHLTASVGAARVPEDAACASDLLAAADRAMRSGRRLGRSQFRFHDPAIDIRNERRLSLDRDLRVATARHELEVYYQPIVELASGRLAGAEALVRWNHSERGPVPPSEFIPTAEATGSIGALSDFVLDAVGENLRRWTDAHLLPPGARVAVNVSASDFNRDDFLGRIGQMLARTGADPRHLELEITESLLLEDLPRAVHRLRELDALGIHVAIDDFGTGYSSLSYLHELPLHTLKIDRRFISEASEGRAGAVTLTILDLARNLGFTAVAEGIEHEHQRAFLARSGCELAQGFLFAPPLPAESFEDYLGDRVTDALAIA